MSVTATAPLSAASLLTATGTVSPTAEVATPPLSSTTATTGAAFLQGGSPTPTATDVPDTCVSPAIAAAYQTVLPTLTATPTPAPTRAPTITPTGTITPTPTVPWWYTSTPTPSSTPTNGPTPGYTNTPGPSPTMGTSCHGVSKGIALGFVVRDGGAQSAATPIVGTGDVGAILDAGAQLARIDFHLVHDDSWTVAEYGAYDAVVNAFVSAHIDVLGLVGPGAVSIAPNPNAWLANSFERSGGNGDNAFLHAYAAQVLSLVGHFHGRIHTWELWNEPNVGAAGVSGTYMYPSNFAAMLADTYALVKQAYPDVTLVCGGLLSEDNAGHSDPQNTGADYLRQTYYMGLQVAHTWGGVRAQFGTNPLDAVGQHLYLDQGSLVYTRHIVAAYRWMHDAYAAFGDGAKPIYVTEGAWSTSAVSPTTQALNLDMLYSMSQNPALPYVARVYWYLLRDGSDASQAYGLRTHDGRPKPAYFRFLAY